MFIAQLKQNGNEEECRPYNARFYASQGYRRLQDYGMTDHEDPEYSDSRYNDPSTLPGQMLSPSSSRLESYGDVTRFDVSLLMKGTGAKSLYRVCLLTYIHRSHTLVIAILLPSFLPSFFPPLPLVERTGHRLRRQWP